MSFVTALPTELAWAAGELQTIGCAVARREYGRDDPDDSVRWTCPTRRTGRC